MRITHIKAHNLRQLAEVDIAIPRDLALVVGPNDAGKTTLLSIAPRWALWGAHAVPSQARMVRHGESDMSVTVEFELAGQHYEVQRRLHLADSGRATPALQFEGEYDLTGATIRETQENIDILIGTYDTFASTAYVDQVEGPGAFMLMTPAAKRDQLGEILSLGKWDAWYEEAASIVSGQLTDITVAESKLEHIRAALPHIPQGRLDVLAAKDSLASAEEALTASEEAKTTADEAVVDVDRRREEYGRAKQWLSNQYAHRGAVLGQVEQALARVEDDDELVRNADAIKEAYDSWVVAGQEYDDEVKRVTGLNQEISERNQYKRDTFAVTVEGINTNNAKLRSDWNREDAHRRQLDPCPTCGAPWNKGEQLKPLPPPMQHEVPTVLEVETLFDVPARQFHDQSVLDKFAELRQVQETALEHQEALSAATRERDQADEEIEDLLKDMPEDVNDEELIRLRETRSARALERQGALTAVTNWVAELSKLQQILDQLLGEEEAAGKLAQEITDAKETLRLSELLAEGLSPQGARQLMLDQALHELELAANGVLAKLMPGFTVHFSTQTATGVETLEEGVRTPSGLMTWRDLGGAASVAVALAVRVGMLQLLNKYRGVNYEHMLLDEADSWLVGERQDGYVRLLQTLVTEQGMTVTAISHIESVQETIEQHIVLTPGANGTEVDLR